MNETCAKLCELRLQRPSLDLPPVTQDSSVEELQYYARLIEKRNLVRYLREEIRYLITQGGVLRTGFDFNECKDETILIVEKNGLKEQLAQKNILAAAKSNMEFLVPKFFVPISRKIQCGECGHVNNVPVANKPITEFGRRCKLCNEEPAQIYMPNCGHVSLGLKCYGLQTDCDAFF